MGSGGSTEAGNQPHDGGSKQQRADPRGNQGREGQRTARSDSPVNNNTPRNAKTKFIIKKDTNSDITNDLDMDSSWKKDSMQNNNQEMKNNEYNKKQNIQHSVLPPRLPTPPEDLPETYAQKKFREQYRQTELLRQKTIYRDPEEWELPEKRPKINKTLVRTWNTECRNLGPQFSNYAADEYKIKRVQIPTLQGRGSVESFDVSKFKAANASSQVQKREIFSMTPDYTKQNRHTDLADDLYQTPSLQKQKSIPKYDVSEEELMADIEKQPPEQQAAC
uniref:Uncharacterized protein n=1 Tax=Magallana gigas TaxID=29159 RepID=K1PLQ1_MAGGI